MIIDPPTVNKVIPVKMNPGHELFGRICSSKIKLEIRIPTPNPIITIPSFFQGNGELGSFGIGPPSLVMVSERYLLMKNTQRTTQIKKAIGIKTANTFSMIY